MPKVFIDGASGTVGLALKSWLIDRMGLQKHGLELIELEAERKRDLAFRADAYKQADLVVLCLPDDEALATAPRVMDANPHARILDASAAHRCEPLWIYGLPQFVPLWAIQNAHRVANPGCFATACILASRPLTTGRSGRMAPLVSSMDFHGVSGYSAGGKQASDTPRLVQFGQAHRHLPEIRQFGEIDASLTTTVGSWYQGMLVQATVDLSVDRVLDRYRASYAADPQVKVLEHGLEDPGRIRIDHHNDSNGVQILVSPMPGTSRTAIAVVMDNLGKGSAGAAAFNLRHMLNLF